MSKDFNDWKNNLHVSQQEKFWRNMKIKPCELKDANIFIEKYHRHHKKVQGHRFSLSLWCKNKMVGVICVGRPVARLTDSSKVLEVTRLCTDGTQNACSKLYSAAARIGKEMGYLKIQTFILETEDGTSLIASGWTRVCTTQGGSWNRKTRKRIDNAPIIKKIKWEKILNRGIQAKEVLEKYERT